VVEKGEDIAVAWKKMSAEPTRRPVPRALGHGDPESGECPDDLAGGQRIEPELTSGLVGRYAPLREQAEDAGASSYGDDPVAGEPPQQALKSVQVEIG
jgi:hypothetical protein